MYKTDFAFTEAYMALQIVVQLSLKVQSDLTTIHSKFGME